MGVLDDEVAIIAKDMDINTDEISVRKAYLEIDDRDVSLLQDLHQQLGNVQPEFVASFYSHLLSFPQTRALLPDDTVIDRLRRAQSAYVNELTSGHFDHTYILNRLKVGLVHQKIGLEPKWYLGAYSKFLSEFIPQVLSLYPAEVEHALDIVRSLMKVVFFDMGLALDSYFYMEREEIIRHRQFAEQIVNCMPTGLLALDSEEKIIMANTAFGQMFGLGMMSPVGSHVSEFLPLEVIDEYLKRIKESGTHIHGIKLQIDNNAPIKLLKASLSPTFLNGVSASLIMLEDLTKEKELQEKVSRSEDWIKAIVENVVDGIVTISTKGLIESFNPAAENIFGYRAEEVIGKNIKILMSDSYATAHDEYLENYVKTGIGKILGVGPRELTGKRKDGSEFPMDLATSEMRIADELYFIGVLRDVSDRHESQKNMRVLNSVVEQTADTVLIADRDGNIVYVNSAFEKITGYNKEEVLGKSPAILRSGKHGKDFYRRLWQAIGAGEVFSEVFINRRKDGSLYYEEKTITPLRDENGRIVQYVSTGKDITERMQIQERFHYLANHDALTELPNRMLLMDRLNQTLSRARWHKRFVAILFIDLDRFKGINDSLGHDVGDELLCQLSGRLVESVREGDSIARMGGDEFVIVLDDLAHLEDVGPLTEKILASLSKPFVLSGQEVFVTASIGISCFPEDGRDSKTLLKGADIAMYRAKENGKNSYQFFSADMSTDAFERLHLESSLRRALERDEFILHYQPQLEFQTGRIVAVEALIRWQHPDMGLVPPLEFIPILEETGLIEDVGEWVFREACAQVRSWNSNNVPIERVSINISPRQFKGRDLFGALERIISAEGIDPSYVEVEITESALMENADETILILNKLRSLGLRIAVDDFGTGYSSLSYLKRFPIDTLKIDRSFVSDLPASGDDVSIVTAIISMAHALGLEVIAEGVETEEQFAFLKEKKCEMLQGYYASKPVSQDRISDLFEQKIL